MAEISDLQRRRAENIIWSAAEDYSFTPDFKAYNADGCAELYWNCIIGAVRRHYDYPQLETLLSGIQQYEDSFIYETLLWLGLENCVYVRELPLRPVLASLRREYAGRFLRSYSPGPDSPLLETLSVAHWQRAAGMEPKLDAYMRALFDDMEFSPEMSTGEIVACSKKLLEKWFQIRTVEVKANKKPPLFKALSGRRKAAAENKNKRLKKFFLGFADHPEHIYGGVSVGQSNDNVPVSKLSETELREFMTQKFGRSILAPAEAASLERLLCTGSHAFCHLHITGGQRIPAGQIKNGFEALSRQREAAQIEHNRQFYKDNLSVNSLAVSRLTSSIRNSVLLYLMPCSVKADSGALNTPAAWRAAALNDGCIFTRTENDSSGDLCVDILLDASTSQKSRQEIISSQAYIIAESLTRCSIPCRVSCFCSMTGYTILRVFRDYGAPSDNGKIFEFVSNGCNRDGLAVRVEKHLISSAPCKHRLLIILSDVKPNDVVRIPGAPDGDPIHYEARAGLNDTAVEVRRARSEGIAVMCIFTGDDEDMPSARLVYGQDFVRIRSLDRFADAVGQLIKDQIKNM